MKQNGSIVVIPCDGCKKADGCDYIDGVQNSKKELEAILDRFAAKFEMRLKCKVRE